jgi:hypothetical protein
MSAVLTGFTDCVIAQPESENANVMTSIADLRISSSSQKTTFTG